MKTIWEILQISQTTDKRLIKKGYARLTRTIHPEEKPEEFKILYEAYQSALAYAENTAKNKSITIPEPEPVADKQTEKQTKKQTKKQTAKPAWKDNDELKSAFQNMEERKNQFYVRWQKFLEVRNSFYELELWLELMNSDLFKSVQNEPWVVQCIVDLVEQGNYIQEEVYEAIWEQYGFEDSESNKYYYELKLLYDSIYIKQKKAKAKRLQFEKEKEEARIGEKRRFYQKMIVFTAAAIAVLALIIVPPVRAALKDANMEKSLESYMEKTYPHTDFTFQYIEPDSLSVGKVSYAGKMCSIQSTEYPDIIATAHIGNYKENKRYPVVEDYGLQIAVRYAEEYGLKSQSWRLEGGEGILAFSYPVIRKSDQKVMAVNLKNFLASEHYQRLSCIDRISFYPEYCLFPEFIVSGGEGGLPQPLSYAVDELPTADDIKRDVTFSYVTYMYNYESWKITPQFEEQYGEFYRNICDQQIAALRLPSGFRRYEGLDYILDIREESGLPIAAYQVTKTHYLSDTMHTTTTPTYITLGNIYLLYKGDDLKLEVKADGSGFSLIGSNNTYEFGKDGEYQAMLANSIYSMKIDRK